MTNAHVASRSPSTMEVGFKDRDFVDARKVYVDPYLDLAIIAIDNSSYLRRPSCRYSIAVICREWATRSERSGIRGV